MSGSLVFSDKEREFIEGRRVAHLATADSESVPHVVPIVYALVDDEIYFVVDEKPKRTRRNLKRLRNIDANPNVAVVIDHYEEDWSRLGYLLIQGTAVEIEQPATYSRVLGLLRQRYPQYRSMQLESDTNPMIRIVPVRTHFWRAAGT